MTKRQYDYCAKCLQAKALPPGAWVCTDCHGTPGLYIGCAVCGKSEGWPEPERCYVCYDDLARV